MLVFFMSLLVSIGASLLETMIQLLFFDFVHFWSHWPCFGLVKSKHRKNESLPSQASKIREIIFQKRHLGTVSKEPRLILGYTLSQRPSCVCSMRFAGALLLLLANAVLVSAETFSEVANLPASIGSLVNADLKDCTVHQDWEDIIRSTDFRIRFKTGLPLAFGCTCF